jgi:hypothetical protein
VGWDDVPVSPNVGPGMKPGGAQSGKRHAGSYFCRMISTGKEAMFPSTRLIVALLAVDEGELSRWPESSRSSPLSE